MKPATFFLLALFSSFLLAGCNKSSNVVAPGSVPRWFESSDSGPFLSMASDGYNLIGSGLNGVFISPDRGLTWIEADSGLPKLGGYHIAVEGNTIIASPGTHEGVFVSTDGGTTWAKADSGLMLVPNATAPGLYQEIVSLAGYGPNIYAGVWNYGVYKTADPITVWSAANEGMPNATVFSFAFIGTYAFAGTNDGIFLSTNGGTKWAPADSGLSAGHNTSGQIPYVESLATNGRSVYAGTLNGEIFVSNDYGKSWTDISAGLPANVGSPVYVGVEDSCLVAGTDTGVYATENNGATWTDITSNIPNPSVTSLFVMDHFIFVSSGGVVWRTPM